MSPYVEAPITGGTVFIAGFTSEADAQRFITDVNQSSRTSEAANR